MKKNNISVIILSVFLLFGCDKESKEQSVTPYTELDYMHADIINVLNHMDKHKKLLLVFGANWCPTCRKIDATFKQAEISDYLHNNFNVIKINVGNYDKNQNIVNQYKTTLKGVPSMVVLNHNDEVLERINPYVIAKNHKKGRSNFFGWIKSL